MKFAYHTLCQDCVEATGHCAKCNQVVDNIINKPETNVTEAARLEAELKQEIKALPERKRRTFLRYLKSQETSKKDYNTILVFQTFLRLSLIHI